MSINAGGSAINSLDNVDFDADGFTITPGALSLRINKVYYTEYTFTGGTTTFDIAEIQMSTSSAVNASGVVKIYLCGSTPPSGSFTSLRGTRRYMYGFYYASGSFSYTAFETQSEDDNGTYSPPTISLVNTSGTTGRGTIAIRIAFGESASTFIWRTTTHVELFAGGTSNANAEWLLT